MTYRYPYLADAVSLSNVLTIFRTPRLVIYALKFDIVDCGSIITLLDLTEYLKLHDKVLRRFPCVSQSLA